MVVTLKALSTSVIEEDPREQGFSSRQSHTEANAQMPGRMWPAEVARPFWTPVVPTGLSALWEGQTTADMRRILDIGLSKLVPSLCSHPFTSTK